MFHVEHSHRDGRWIFSDMLMFHVEHWHMVENRVIGRVSWKWASVMHLKVRKMDYFIIL